MKLGPNSIAPVQEKHWARSALGIIGISLAIWGFLFGVAYVVIGL